MKQRITKSIPSGLVSYDSILGATVKIKCKSMQNAWAIKDFTSTSTYTIGDIKFSISIDGKCYAIIALDGIEDRTFKLQDLEIVELNGEDSKES
jgi:hypothetical protein